MDQIHRRSLQERGYTVLPGLLSAAEAQGYRKALDARAGAGLKDGPLKWSCPGGVSASPEFWALLDDRLLRAVRGAFGADELRYTEHSDLKVWRHQPSTGWHRDSVSDCFQVGTEWDETREPYHLVRVAFYLQLPEAGFRWGCIPGTHRRERLMGKTARLFWKSVLRETTAIGSRLSYLQTEAGRLWIQTGTALGPPAEPVWLTPALGDCLLFDPRLIHAGGDVPMSKQAVFCSLGADNEHARRHARSFHDCATGAAADGKPNGVRPEFNRYLAARGLLSAA